MCRKAELGSKETMRGNLKWLALALGAVLSLVLTACEEPQPVGGLSPATLPAEARLASLSFVDADHGWVVAANCLEGSGTPTGGCRALVYSTRSGGKSWAPAGRLLLVPRGMQFTDLETGWLIGTIGQRCGNATCPNVVMQTTDAGRTWQRTSTTSVELADVRFVSARDGWILGQACVSATSCAASLVFTDSAGQTWSNEQLPLNGHGFHLDRLNASVGWVGGIVDGRAVLIATGDGGKSWARLETPCQGDALAFDFPSAERGWLACSGTGSVASGFFQTEDGGRTWQARPLPGAGSLTGGNGGGLVSALGFTSPDFGWVLDGGKTILNTRDGGKTWATSLTANQPLVTGRFLDASHGWFADRQSVWGTDDGGRTWKNVAVGGDAQGGSVTMSVK